MRLIDADELRKKLLIMEFMEDVVEIVDSTSTEYDVDKVVEELERKERDVEFMNEFGAGYNSALYNAIEIVRNGGGNND